MSARAVPMPAPQNISRNIFPGNSRHILITGASAGLGAALAEAYAAPGMRLSLAGRDAERLTAVAAICVAQGRPHRGFGFRCDRCGNGVGPDAGRRATEALNEEPLRPNATGYLARLR